MVTANIRRSAPLLLSALLSTSTFIALGTFLGGCENPTAQADKKVGEQVNTAQEKTSKPEDRPALLTALDSAAKAPGISPTAKMNIRLEQARIETDQADDMARKVA